jgi:hypothetical protein
LAQVLSDILAAAADFVVGGQRIEKDQGKLVNLAGAPGALNP